MTGRGPSAGELLVWCGTGAVVGAVGGYLLLFQQREPLVTLGVVLAASALGTLVGMLAVAPEPAPPVRRVPPRPPAAGAAATPPIRPRSAAPVEPVGTTEPARLVLPVEAAPQGTWWNGGPTDRTVAQAPALTAPARPPAPDLGTYRRPVRTVQCPRCGAFRIDVQETAGDQGGDQGGYAFRCRVDDHTWTWRAGTAWPVTVVASRRRPGR